MKILDTIWFTPMSGHTLGIVMGEDEVTKERKAYIGVAEGYDEHTDTRIIADTGVKIYPTQIDALKEHFRL